MWESSLLEIMAINKGYLTADRSSAGDEVYTPFYAVEPLTEFLPKDKIIWCPFDEKWSAFYRYFRENHYPVIRSSLREGQNLFEYEPENWDILVSNPPFSKKDDVLKRAYQLGKPFALLLPVNSIQGKARFKIFNNEIQMLVFDSRIDYHTPENMQNTIGGNSFGSAYFCRDLLPTKLELWQLEKYYRQLKYDKFSWIPPALLPTKCTGCKVRYVDTISSLPVVCKKVSVVKYCQIAILRHLLTSCCTDTSIRTTIEIQNFCDFLQKLKRIRFQAKKIKKSPLENTLF